ncbi:MAG: ArsR/SmtB family transcription factor [Halorientalis sp.]
MTDLLPFRTTVEDRDREPRIVDIDDEAADEVFRALSSRTARRLLAALHEQPRPASDLADAVDTSIQNVHYHLDKLSDVGLVEVVDTWYSERGREMKVYAPADDSLVVFAGEDRPSALRRVLKALGALLVGGVVVWYVFRALEQLGGAPASGGGDGGADGPPPASDPGGTTTTGAETANATTRANATAAPPAVDAPAGGIDALAAGASIELLAAAALLGAGIAAAAWLATR